MSESRRNFIAHRPTDVVRKRSSAYGNPVRTHAVSGVSVASKLPPWESWKTRGFSPDAAYRAWGCGGSLTKSAKGAIEINAKADGIDEGNSVKSLVENGGSE